jgi:hypothetical protein
VGREIAGAYFIFARTSLVTIYALAFVNGFVMNRSKIYSLPGSATLQQADMGNQSSQLVRLIMSVMFCLVLSRSF